MKTNAQYQADFRKNHAGNEKYLSVWLPNDTKTKIHNLAIRSGDTEKAVIIKALNTYYNSLTE